MRLNALEGRRLRDAEHTRCGYHSLDICDTNPRCLACCDEHAREIKIIAMASECGDNDVPNHCQTGSLIHCARDNISGTIIVGVHSSDTDGESGSIGEIRDLHGIEFPVACQAVSHSLIP